MKYDTVENKGVLHWINSAKGIGVILVLLGHLLYESNLPILNKMIYSFHMPMFFMLSGYVQHDIINRKLFVRKKVYRLMYPFLAFTIVGMPIWGLVILRNGGTIEDVLLNTFYIKGSVSNNPLWYLIVLFEINVLISVIDYPIMEMKYQFYICIFFILMGYIAYTFSYRLKILNLFGLNRMIICTVFYMIGILLNRAHFNFNRRIILAISLMFCVVSGTIINSKVSIYGFYLGKYVPFLIAAISGSIGMISFCTMKLNHESILTKLSQYSVLFLGCQYFFILPFKAIVKRIGMSETYLYDIAMIIFTGLLLLVIPPIYIYFSKKIRILKVFNGEVL